MAKKKAATKKRPVRAAKKSSPKKKAGGKKKAAAKKTVVRKGKRSARAAKKASPAKRASKPAARARKAAKPKMTVTIEKPQPGELVVTEPIGGSIQVHHTVHEGAAETPIPGKSYDDLNRLGTGTHEMQVEEKTGPGP